ncbi:cation:proton antiporter [Xylanimonas oleitrophica]|uniref:Cation:proton antiporter n=1 Tax=Xylanimonas oleitrophica TaxID=2607479 RepID=A0A2W5X3Q4_9MICO|nr:monovalent cation/H(+) antiporter subunit G [Xylanimonas oleitrophica]PZR55035.1 cation:proton antiporter [Xylanimonas oleitrophica]
MTQVLAVIGQVLVVLGALTFLSAGLGLLRFPDLYTRASAVSTAAGFGIVQVVVGVLLLQPALDSTVKVVIAVALQLATSAVGSMALARSAYLTGPDLAPSTTVDEIAAEGGDGLTGAGTPDDRPAAPQPQA